MTVLWVIGNGFDLQHKIKSTYLDFSNWLHESIGLIPSPCGNILNSKCPTDYCHQWGELPVLRTTYNGDEEVDDKVAVPLICQVISNANPASNAWCDLEANLSGLDVSAFFDELEPTSSEDEDDENDWRSAYQSEDLRDAIIQAIGQLPTYFRSWVQDELGKPELRQQSAIKAAFNAVNSQFLTFNYTSTLQDLYNIPDSDICHIHGKASEKNSKLRFGHDAAIRTVEEGFEGDWEREAEFEIDRSLKKEVNPTELDRYRDSGISAIIFFGFGFGPADHQYVVKLSEICTPDTPIAILAPEKRLSPTITRASQQIVPHWRPPIGLTLETPNLAEYITRIAK